MFRYADLCPDLVSNLGLGPEDLYLIEERVRPMLLSVDRSDATAGQSLSFNVIAAVAEQEDIDPVDLEPPNMRRSTMLSIPKPSMRSLRLERTVIRDRLAASNFPSVGIRSPS